MVIYFSATGNCEFIAKKLAKATDDKAVNLLDLKDKITLSDGETLGFVTPTYYWRLPSIVDEILHGVKIENGQNSYVYFIATYGTTTGQTDYYMNKHLKCSKLKLSASFAIKTVDNYTLGFSVNDKEEIEKTLLLEAQQIDEILIKIKAKKREFIKGIKKPLLLCGGAKACYDKARKTFHFNVNTNCSSCGKCEKDCPTSAIKILNGKPTWVKDKCAMCFRCLHRCPTFAINYDDKTQLNGQYVHPEFQD